MRPLRGFEEQIDELADAVRSSPPRAGFEQVQMPGDKELGSVRHLRSVGVPLSEQTLAELERLRKELMLESPLTPFPAETENG
jgi:LDH2 family malate/lactate/ureidoglycolate dehydrogenase